MIHNRLCELRKKNNLSQEQLADVFGVSRQAVQKWENGSSVPEIGKLIAIGKYFHVSMDLLLCNDDTRTTEELRLNKEITPNYESMQIWESYSIDLMTEYKQCMDEGRDIEKLKPLFEAVSSLPQGKEKEQFSDVIFNMVFNVPQREDYAFYEPSTLEEIQFSRPDLTFNLSNLPSKELLQKKIRGAWIGRICGCLLGKPVECIKTNELIPLLKETNNYPMYRYIRQAELSEELYGRYTFNINNHLYPDVISCAPVDDDTNYTVMASYIIEHFGKDFKPYDVAKTWLEKQHKDAFCTAERIAYRNFINGYMPPDSAIYKNPYREWIGAQIRGDYYGYINPGNPEGAAAMAWRDASISHTKNGIYGEMFVAATLAGAVVLNDIKQIIQCGLSQIPKTSRLFARVTSLMDEYEKGVSSNECFAKIHKLYDENISHGWCHILSNAEIVVAALLYGNLDYSKSICMAVEAGFDTDCNGATVGSIIGMINGIDGIPAEWYKPIHDTLDTSLFGIGKVKISDMIDLTIKHINVN